MSNLQYLILSLQIFRICDFSLSSQTEGSYKWGFWCKVCTVKIKVRRSAGSRRECAEGGKEVSHGGELSKGSDWDEVLCKVSGRVLVSLLFTQQPSVAICRQQQDRPAISQPVCASHVAREWWKGHRLHRRVKSTYHVIHHRDE